MFAFSPQAVDRGITSQTPAVTNLVISVSIAILASAEWNSLPFVVRILVTKRSAFCCHSRFVAPRLRDLLDFIFVQNIDQYKLLLLDLYNMCLGLLLSEYEHIHALLSNIYIWGKKRRTRSNPTQN